MRIILTLWLLLATPTFAANGYVPPLTILKQHFLITVRADATSEETFEQSYRINTDQAVSTYGTEVIPFNSSHQTVRVLEAYTQRPDGKRIPVAKNAIRIQNDPVSDGVPMFSDVKNLVIVFPNVEKGSLIHYKTLTREFKPLFPGHFSRSYVYTPSFPILDAKVELRHSPKIKIRTEAPGMMGGQVTDIGGMNRYIYQYRNETALPMESMQVDFADFSPRFRASNFENWEAVGIAYEREAKPAAAVTPKVQAIADEITRNISERIDQIKAIYFWVSRNIRYVSVDLGNGGVIPHRAEDILRNRYGDCKDHAALLQALLGAKGIPTSQVLIQWGSSYQLPGVPGLGPFNHAINYVPELDLFLDTTAQFAPFGSLPEGEHDKPVVVTGLGKVSRTPVGKARDHQLTAHTELQMQPDGRIKGTSHVLATGIWENSLRSEYSSYVSMAQERVVNAILSANGESGQGEYKTADPLDLSVPFTLDSNFELDAPANVPGPSGIVIPIGLSPGMLDALETVRVPEVRYFPRQCNATTLTENTVLTFPSGIKVEAIPRNADIRGAGKHYTASYTLKDNTVAVVRHYEAEFERGYCDPSINDADRQFLDALRRDLRAQIVYR